MANANRNLTLDVPSRWYSALGTNRCSQLGPQWSVRWTYLAVLLGVLMLAAGAIRYRPVTALGTGNGVLASNLRDAALHWRQRKMTTADAALADELQVWQLSPGQFQLVAPSVEGEDAPWAWGQCPADSLCAPPLARHKIRLERLTPSQQLARMGEETLGRSTVLVALADENGTKRLFASGSSPEAGHAFPPVEVAQMAPYPGCLPELEGGLADHPRAALAAPGEGNTWLAWEGSWVHALRTRDCSGGPGVAHRAEALTGDRAPHTLPLLTRYADKPELLFVLQIPTQSAPERTAVLLAPGPRSRLETLHVFEQGEHWFDSSTELEGVPTDSAVPVRIRHADGRLDYFVQTLATHIGSTPPPAGGSVDETGLLSYGPDAEWRAFECARPNPRAHRITGVRPACAHLQDGLQPRLGQLLELPAGTRVRKLSNGQLRLEDLGTDPISGFTCSATALPQPCAQTPER